MNIVRIVRNSIPRAWQVLPRGRLLPDDVWRARHQIVLTVLWLHVPAIMVFALLVGETAGDSALVATIVAAMAIVATPPRLGRSVRSVAACVGLVTTSAILVHLSGGYIEMHFHFFVMVALMAIYQEWMPFLVAIAYVVVHHGVMGILAPASVFNHHAGIHNPLFWAVVHGGFILALSAVCLVSWSYSYRAVIDTLTGLANRALLSQRLETLLSQHGIQAGTVALLYIDLDDFKHVNDSLGHTGGDELLKTIAERLVRVVPRGPTIARLGGDEFAIVLADTGSREAAALAAQVVEALDEPVKIGTTEVYSHASIGIALNGPLASDAESLLRNADMAMYDSKAAGKAQVRFFRPALHAAHLQRLEFESEIRRGLENNEFLLHYQPIVDVGTGSTFAVEALMRWQHPTRGVLQPAEFIPLAEETGLIVGLGRWAVRAALMQLREWQQIDAWPAGIGMTVNVSARELKMATYIDDVTDALAHAGIAGEHLTLEVTETVLLSEPEVAAGRLHALKAAGIRIAIDDFGTGYSSLNYLTRLPVDILKIDRALTAAIGENGAGSAVMQAALALGRHLGFKTVAEGVEDDAQLRRLNLMGCRLVQGFLFARPMDPDAARDFVLGRRSGQAFVGSGVTRGSKLGRGTPHVSTG